MRAEQCAKDIEKRLAVVRLKKVQKIKKLISSGSYKVDNQRLAKSLFIAQ